MKSVSVSKLKANLARYLRDAQRGSEVLVTDRGKPIAVLVAPVRAPIDSDARLARLVARGIVTAPQAGKLVDYLKHHPPLKVPGGKPLSDALVEEREESF